MSWVLLSVLRIYILAATADRQIADLRHRKTS